MAYRLTTVSGVAVTVLTLGGIVQSFRVPDGSGGDCNVVLGFDSVADYEADPAYMGALIGRYAGRLAGSVIEIDGVCHRLSANEETTCLHGGRVGFGKLDWTARVVDRVGLELSHVSPDGDQGFPGSLSVTALFQLAEDGTLGLEFNATTTRPTALNLTHHGYWNLAGHGRINDHLLKVDAESYLPVGAHNLPTGARAEFGGRVPDLRTASSLGDRAIDHAYVLTTQSAAELHHLASGRRLEITTDQPCLQVYTGEALGGRRTGPRSGVALEPQRPAIPLAILRPGETWHSRTSFKVSW